MDILEQKRRLKNQYQATYQRVRRMFDEDYKNKTNEISRRVNQNRYESDEAYRLEKSAKVLERYYKKKLQNAPPILE